MPQNNRVIEWNIDMVCICQQMKNKNIKNAKGGHQDDCQDCRREKKQNEALISMYERLQAIDNNSKLMRKSLEKHKQELGNTNTKFVQFSQRFNQLPKQNKTNVQLKNLGFDLAHTMMYEVSRGPVARENEKLKSTLAQMYKPKPGIRLPDQIKTKRSLSVSTDYMREETKVTDKAFGIQPRATSFKIYEPDLRKSTNFEKITQVRQPQQTRTTGFFSQDTHNPKLQGLNLWLYEQNESKSLEQELYETRMPSKHRMNKVAKVRGTVLPALRTTGLKNC